ncbi:MAG: pili assembly chaperone, partial [Acidobacteria bacterium]|nr:pili assembly chaperone [Acidobacteriota bacterium]MBI3662743.1 pili assembly chaperone [Acidobacteriota bacterium]
AAGAAPTAAAADLIDSVLAAGTKSGYTFTYTAGAAAAGTVPTYTLNGDPVTAGTTGQRHFFTDQSGVVRADPAAKATVASTPI